MWEFFTPPLTPSRYQDVPRCSSASRLLSLWGKTGSGRPCLGCARRKFLAPALWPALAANLAWPCLHQCGIPHPYGWNRPISQIILEIAGIPSGPTANSENHMARTRGNGISYIALAPLPPILPGPYHHVHNPNRLEGNGQFPHLPGTRYTNQQTRHPSPHRFSDWRGFHTFSNPCHTRFYSLTPPQINHSPHFRHPKAQKYRNYSPIFISVSLALNYGLSFAAITSVELESKGRAGSTTRYSASEFNGESHYSSYKEHSTSITMTESSASPLQL